MTGPAALSPRILVTRLALAAGVLALAPPASRAQAVPVFSDVTAGSGIKHTNVCGEPGRKKFWITETMGAGAAWLDYDGDGKLDLYLVNGSTYARGADKGEPNQLYRGDGRGKFTDVTAKAGVGDRGWGHGVAVGDIDNDGDPDLYVVNLGPNALYRNRGDGTFENITAKAGVADPGWGTSAAFFDIEGDGDLDLYVANYVDFDPAKVPKFGSPEAARRPTCTNRGLAVFCGPAGLPPGQDVLYRNNGDGTFTDATREAGMFLDKPRYGLGVVTLDFDGDGDLDLYVANDSVENSLWRNDGKGRFTDIGVRSLTALDAAGRPQAGMGTDSGDYNNDGWIDLVATNFSHDLNTLYRNMGGKFFVDESQLVGMSATKMALSWGVGFQDFDLDGDLDLFIANGHVYPHMDDYDVGLYFRQRNHLFLNQGGRFAEVSTRAGKGFEVARSFRGAAFADYDADGDIDALVTALDEPVLLLRNDSPRRGHYLELELVGTRSNRDAVGARVTVTAGGKRQARERKGGGSYLSQSAPTLHFGLGAATSALVQVRWPDGSLQELRDVAVDRRVVIRQAAAAKSN